MTAKVHKASKYVRWTDESGREFSTAATICGRIWVDFVTDLNFEVTCEHCSRVLRGPDERRPDPQIVMEISHAT
jgi:hypothetical protein